MSEVIVTYTAPNSEKAAAARARAEANEKARAEKLAIDNAWLITEVAQLAGDYLDLLPGNHRRTLRVDRLAAAAVDRLGWLAVKHEQNPADVATAALAVWRKKNFDLSDRSNAWGWTKVCVENQLSDQLVADILGIDAETLKRSNHSTRTRIYGGVIVDRDEQLLDLFEAPGAAEAPVERFALKVAIAALVRAGLHQFVAEGVIDAMVSLALGDGDWEGHAVGRPAGVTSSKSAVTKLMREKETPETLGVPREVWTAAVSLVFGSETGTPGLLVGEAQGMTEEECLKLRPVSMATRRLAKLAA